jgi:hypothetical protein
MKIGCFKRPDFGSRRGGLGQTKSGGGFIEVDCIIFFVFLLCFLLCFSPLFFSFPSPKITRRNNASTPDSYRDSRTVR